MKPDNKGKPKVDKAALEAQKKTKVKQVTTNSIILKHGKD